MRYLGFEGKKVTCVLDSASAPCGSIQVPEELGDVSGSELLSGYEVWNGKVYRKGESKPAKQLRVALVGPYRSRCGISTYSERLFPLIARQVGESRIFSETIEGIPEEFGVDRCWTRGLPLDGLAEKIRAYDPDVILIEHGYDIFPEARHWLSLMSRLETRRTLVTLHSVSLEPGRIVHEAAIPEIIVHSDAARSVLADKGFAMPIHIVPHGCDEALESDPIANPYGSDHTIVQFGFGFPYKGWESALMAVHALRERYPDIFYTALFGENPRAKLLHENYLVKLKILIRELGIESNVAILSGYPSTTVLNGYLRSNRIAVFPYVVDNGIDTVYAASGAVRIAMQAGLPTIVSQAPIFSDLEGVCPRVADTEELCREISNMFDDAAAHHQQAIRQSWFLKTNCWENVAKQHIDLLVG